MGMDTMAAYAAAKERVLGRARDAGMVRQDLTANDMTAVVWMALAIRAQNGPRHRRQPPSTTLLFDGLRPTGQRLPAARSESPSGSANREPRRSHKRPCSGRPTRYPATVTGCYRPSKFRLRVLVRLRGRAGRRRSCRRSGKRGSDRC